MEEEVKDIGSIPTLLPQLSALEIHNNILRCHRLGSRVHRTMLEWLWALIEKDDWVDLGSGGPMSYVVKQLGYGRSEASDILGVARKLHEIPLSVTAFDEGRISWDKLKAIASVAKPGKEAAWLERAAECSADALRAQAHDAETTGSEGPPKGSAAVLNLPVTVKFRFPRADREIVRKAFEKRAFRILQAEAEGRKGAVEAMERRKGRKLTHEEVLLAFCLEELETEAGAGSERTRAFCDIVFHICSECRKPRLLTRDGPVEVTEEYVRKFEGSARKIVIGSEEDLVPGELVEEGEGAEGLSAELERKVLALYGRRCVHCGRRLGLHIHHVRFRSNGGADDLTNLLCWCRLCHASLHAKSLEVFRDSLGELYWRRKADKLAALLADEVKELVAIPAVTVVAAVSAPAAGGTAEAKEEMDGVAAAAPGAAEVPAEAAASAPAAPTKPRVDRKQKAALREVMEEADRVIEVLQQMGYKRRKAQEQVTEGIRVLEELGRPPTGNEILNAALRGRAVLLEARGSAIADAPSGRVGPRGPAITETGGPPAGGPDVNGSGIRNCG